MRFHPAIRPREREHMDLMVASGGFVPVAVDGQVVGVILAMASVDLLAKRKELVIATGMNPESWSPE